MAIFDGKDGKKKFHINPQMGKALHSSESAPKKTVGEISKKVNPKVPTGGAEGHDQHEHNGHKLANHVEIHRGGHEGGSPPMHEGHTHHVISHRGSGSSLSPDVMEKEVSNHESYDDAQEQARGEMHAECPECGHPMSEENEEAMGSEEEMGEGSYA